MKVALCFIISYAHQLHKETIWKEWIDSLGTPINIYFHYDDINKIKSSWIRQHCIPIEYCQPTSYYYVVPAYISLIKYALHHDSENTWFCFLTDSCCPIISPTNFDELFRSTWNQSIFSWKPAWWNVQFTRRSNLRLLPPTLRLGNDPWFIFTRPHAELVYKAFINPRYHSLIDTVCRGGLANESLFSIILHTKNKLARGNEVICTSSHLCNWSHMSSPTSPHIFMYGTDQEWRWIVDNRSQHKYICFLRKVHHSFPDQIIRSIWNLS